MAYLRGLRHGLAAGLAVGILIAPRPGPETRRRLAHGYSGVREVVERTGEAATRAWRAAQPAAAGARVAAGVAVRLGTPVARGLAGHLHPGDREHEPFFSFGDPGRED